MVDKDTEAILKKYGTQLNSLNSEPIYSNKDFSNEFVQFKEDMMPKFSKYERLCKNIGGSIGIKLAQKDEDNLRREINSAHLDVTPSQVVALATLMFIFVFIGGVILTTAIYLISNPPYFSVLLLLLSFLTAGFLFYYFYSMPSRLATQWRLKAGSQMVPCILYTVIYMKHTSNLERAIRFASEHLEPPLALDLKKVFWDVEVGRFSTIKESLDSYLESWRLSNPEFVESFNLIESSLYEPSDSRRIQILERALQVILDGVYDRMLKFTHDVKAPLTNLYMLGIVLPTLGLALLPLGSALLNGAIKWFHILIFFNILIPFFVFYMTSQIMATRPGGYGESSILELNPLYSKYKSKKSYLKAGLIVLPLFLIGIFPLLLSIPGFAGLLNINPDVSFGSLGIGFLSDIKLFDIIQGVGPMGPVALLMSLFIPLSVFLFFSISYKARTKDIIKSRDYSKVLEGEFNNSLFQLGNRIGDGTPAELAFGKVIESSRGQVTENFFKIVNSNIQSSGMSLEKAIFDPRRGAILNYPSNLISTSMHILIESARKGLKVAAESLMSIADYVRNINKINDRLRDLLADVISDMKSNMTFLAPLLAGIVVGLSSMITLILSKLTAVITAATASTTADLSTFGSISSIVKIFDVNVMIPPYFLQICVGIYIVEIIFILTKALVSVDAGEDELKETSDIAKNLISGGLLYLIVALIAIVALSLLSGIALNSIGVGV